MIKVKWQNMQTDRNQGKKFYERDTKRNIKYVSRVKDTGKTLAFSQFAIRKSVLNFRWAVFVEIWKIHWDFKRLHIAWVKKVEPIIAPKA